MCALQRKVKGKVQARHPPPTWCSLALGINQHKAQQRLVQFCALQLLGHDAQDMIYALLLHHPVHVVTIHITAHVADAANLHAEPGSLAHSSGGNMQTPAYKSSAAIAKAVTQVLY